MDPNKKKVTSLVDLMADEIEEFNETLDDVFEYLDVEEDEENSISEGWDRALKDLEELGFMEDDN